VSLGVGSGSDTGFVQTLGDVYFLEGQKNHKIRLWLDEHIVRLELCMSEGGLLQKVGIGTAESESWGGGKREVNISVYQSSERNWRHPLLRKPHHFLA